MSHKLAAFRWLAPIFIGAFVTFLNQAFLVGKIKLIYLSFGTLNKKCLNFKKVFFYSVMVVKIFEKSTFLKTIFVQKRS